MMQKTKLKTTMDTVVTSTDRNLMTKTAGWPSLNLVDVTPDTACVPSMSSITSLTSQHQDDCVSPFSLPNCR